ncbi:hypothetical protein TWF788_001139 [Orbilia oligospora]|uniref:Uncharacterized protein n=1 Tax=Orbilia oligospora TaxID=2813651 RepID=A0A7C8K5V1_ORBOL|nr:hypothetical protein TWF788_001139 [Orbilia oligospora]
MAKKGKAANNAAKNKQKPAKGKTPDLSTETQPSNSREPSPPPPLLVEESKDKSSDVTENKSAEIIEDKPSGVTENKEDIKRNESIKDTAPQNIPTQSSKITETKPSKVTELAPQKPLGQTNPSYPTLQSISQKWDQKSQELKTAVDLLLTASTHSQKEASRKQLATLAKEFITLREELTEAEESNNVGDIIPIRVSMIESLKNARKVLDDFFAKDEVEVKEVEAEEKCVVEVEEKCVVEIEMASIAEEMDAIETEKTVSKEGNIAVEKVQDGIGNYDEKEAAVEKGLLDFEREGVTSEAEKITAVEERIPVEVERIAIEEEKNASEAARVAPKEEKVQIEQEKNTIEKELVIPQKQKVELTKESAASEKESADTKEGAVTLDKDTKHEGPTTGQFRVDFWSMELENFPFGWNRAPEIKITPSSTPHLEYRFQLLKQLVLV